MTEELNPQTFDLIAALSGRSYPTLDVTIYLDEALGFEIHKLQGDLASAEARGDEEESARLYKEKAAKVKQASQEAFTVTLKSIPESVRRTVIAKVQEDFPEKSDLLGRPLPNPAADEEFTKKMWRAYIVSVTAPDGSVKAVDEADVNALYANAPNSAIEAITVGIRELQTGASAGYEHAAKEIDFLSQASPEG